MASQSTHQVRKRRLVIVSNRLPIVLKPDPNGGWKVIPGSGGLVTALAPVLRDRGGLWIGWSGLTETTDRRIDRLLNDAVSDTGYAYEAVSLTEDEVHGYYYGFANEVLWPLFHDLQTRCNFDPHFWTVYRQVNRKFASAIAEHTHPSDTIWVHDYHLMGVAADLRRWRPKTKIGFFLHIPFPPLDIFLKLPWRFEILNALLAYDVVGFQTQRDKRNFIGCLRKMRHDVTVRGKGQVVTATVDRQTVRVGSFPISIDFKEFASAANTREVAGRVSRIRSDLGSGSGGRKLLLGVDRLDYTKGIPERLKAFANALERYPRLRGKACLVQLVVPSRELIPKYKNLKLEIERLVSRINGRFAQTDWLPVHYMYRSVDRTELLALYRAADIALITPLKDGMNLVAKEYCSSNIDNDGVLILSEFAGAAPQLQAAALLVNPFHVEAVADTVAAACDMPKAERQRRMKALRKKIRQTDIYWWLDSFLGAGFDRDLMAFPPPEDYIPHETTRPMTRYYGQPAWMSQA